MAPEGLDCSIPNSLGIMEIAIHLPWWHPSITAYAACYRMEMARAAAPSRLRSR